MNIEKLEESVQSQLRSDLTTHSITNCVIELVENAIDAESKSIAVRINLQTFTIQVIDNGVGMTEEQLQTIGVRYCTSKWNSKLRSKYFGYRGESLANLRRSCTRLMIITRTPQDRITFCKIFENNRNSTVIEALHHRVSKGTTVIMNNVLGNTPVRQACIIPSVELQNVKQYIRAVALMHPSISFSVKDDSKSVEILQVKRAKSTQKQFENLYPCVVKKGSMFKFVSEIGDIKIKTIICDRMCEYKKLQFVFINKLYIVNSDIQKYFKSLLFKSFRDIKMKESLEVRSSWQPVFILNVSCPEDECHIFFELNKRHVEFRKRHTIKMCLVKLCTEFRRSLGLEKASLPYLRGSSRNKVSDTKETFISKELFEKLKNANTLFGIPVRRQAVMKQHDERKEERRLIYNEEDTFVKEPIGTSATVSGLEEERLVRVHKLDSDDNDATIEKEFQQKNNFKIANKLEKEETENRESAEMEENYRTNLQDNQSPHFKMKKNVSSQFLSKNLVENVFEHLHKCAFEGEAPMMDVTTKDITPQAAENVEIKIHSIEGYHARKTEDENSTKIFNSDIQREKKKRKFILREPRLKLDDFFNFEFPLESANTSVNYLQKRSFSTHQSTNNAMQKSSLPKNYRHIDNKMMKLNIADNSSLHVCSEMAISPRCNCSCHKIVEQENSYSISKFQDAFDCDKSCDKINFDSSVTESVNCKKIGSDNFHFNTSGTMDMKSKVFDFFKFTPFVESPYFIKSSEKNAMNMDQSDLSVLDANENVLYEEKCTSDNPARTDNRTVCQIVENFSLQSFREKMKYKMKCKLLSTAGVVDVPKGMLEASNLKTRNVMNFPNELGKNFHEMMRPYSLKNHITLDDEGLSCLRIFPYLKKDEGLNANCCNLDKELNCPIPCTKADLKNVQFLSQIDKKFLLANLETVSNEQIIVIFDQHAVDERVRVERILQNYTDKDGTWKSISVNPAIYPDVTPPDISIITDFQSSFREKGLYFKFNKVNTQTSKRPLIAVVKVPLCLHSAAIKEVTGSDCELRLKELVGSLMKEMIEILSNPQNAVQNSFPETLLKLINYEACRGAVKFGDKLPNKVCVSLLKNIATCAQPFQCAHGRPLMNPLISFSKVEALVLKSTSRPKKSVKEMWKLLQT